MSGAIEVCPGPFRTLSEAKNHGLVFDVPRKHCRWCGVPCTGRRSSFCSGAPTNSKRGQVIVAGSGCVHEWLLRTDPGYLRREVFRRDGGVCKVCGLNVPILLQATRSIPLSSWVNQRPDWHVTREGALGAIGFTVREAWGSGGWHADHIVPVERGGGLCGLDGMQTLCAPCHRRKTIAERVSGREAA